MVDQNLERSNPSAGAVTPQNLNFLEIAGNGYPYMPNEQNANAMPAVINGNLQFGNYDIYGSGQGTAGGYYELPPSNYINGTAGVYPTEIPPGSYGPGSYSGSEMPPGSYYPGANYPGEMPPSGYVPGSYPGEMPSGSYYPGGNYPGEMPPSGYGPGSYPGEVPPNYGPSPCPGDGSTPSTTPNPGDGSTPNPGDGSTPSTGTNNPNCHHDGGQDGQHDLTEGKSLVNKGNELVSMGQKEEQQGAKQVSALEREMRFAGPIAGPEMLQAAEKEEAQGRQNVATGDKDIQKGMNEESEGRRDIANGDPNKPKTAQDYLNDGKAKIKDGHSDITSGERDMANSAWDNYAGRSEIQKGEYELYTGNVAQGRMDITTGEQDLNRAYSEQMQGQQQFQDGTTDIGKGRTQEAKGWLMQMGLPASDVKDLNDPQSLQNLFTNLTSDQLKNLQNTVLPELPKGLIEQLAQQVGPPAQGESLQDWFKGFQPSQWQQFDNVIQNWLNPGQNQGWPPAQPMPWYEGASSTPGNGSQPWSVGEGIWNSVAGMQPQQTPYGSFGSPNGSQGYWQDNNGYPSYSSGGTQPETVAV